VNQPRLEMQRLVGKFALLFAFIYFLILFGVVMFLAQGESFVLLSLVLILLPAAAVVPAVTYAVRLHLTTEPARLTDLWRRCAVYAISGLVLTVLAGVIFGRMNGP